MEEKVFFVYLTENLVNGKMYIGQHQCDYDKQFTDGYLGSGIAIEKAIKKYGKDNFVRTILEYANSQEELNELERKYVNEEIVEDENFYNLTIGGRQNISVTDSLREKLSKSHIGQKAWNKGVPMSEEQKEKLRKSHIGKKLGKRSQEAIEKTRNALTGRKRTAEQRKRISDSHLGQNPWNKGVPMSEEQKHNLSEKLTGRKLPEEVKQQMRERVKGNRWFNNGIENKFCKACPDGYVEGRIFRK